MNIFCKNKILCYFLLLTSYFLLATSHFSFMFAQAPDTLWTKRYGWYYGSDFGNSIQQTSDGGYIITGTTRGWGPRTWNLYLLKTGADGDTMWEKAYGGPDWDIGYSAQETNDGGYIAVGYTWYVETLYVYLIKTDVNGDSLWTKRFAKGIFNVGYAIQQTSDNGYIICGYTGSFGASGRDVYLIKTDTNGDTIWTKTYGGVHWDEGFSVQQTTDSGYIITGYTEKGDTASTDVYLIKTDSSGDTLWTRTFGSAGSFNGNFDEGLSVQQTFDGGYVVVGSFGDDIVLLKTNANGDTLWTKTFGAGGGWEEAYSVEQTSDGGYIIGGFTESFLAEKDNFYFVRTDLDGDTLWTKMIGWQEIERDCFIRQTSDGGYIVVGSTDSFTDFGYEICLIRFAPDTFAVQEAQTANPSPICLEIYPNPFRKHIEIRCMIHDTRYKIQDFSLKIYDAAGRLVKDFLRPTLNAVRPTLIWSGTDQANHKLPNGVYFLRLKTEDKTAVEKLILLR